MPINKKKNKFRLSPSGLVTVILLILFLIIGVFILNNGMSFNLNKWARETDPICIPGEKQHKPCSSGSQEKTRVCNSKGTGWSPWSGCANREPDPVVICKTCLGRDLKTCNLSTGACQVQTCSYFGCSTSGNCNASCNTTTSDISCYCNSNYSGSYCVITALDGKKFKVNESLCPQGTKCVQKQGTPRSPATVSCL